MGDQTTRRATLRIFTPESAGTFRVTDPLAKREIGTFTVEELAAGIPIDLPSQERVLRVLERRLCRSDQEVIVWRRWIISTNFKNRKMVLFSRCASMPRCGIICATRGGRKK